MPEAGLTTTTTTPLCYSDVGGAYEVGLLFSFSDIILPAMNMGYSELNKFPIIVAIQRPVIVCKMTWAYPFKPSYSVCI